MTGRIPAYRLHRPSGQAVVTLNGHDHYLGKHGTTESRAAYDHLIARWLADGKRPIRDAQGPSINEVLLAFWEHAQDYYRKNGRATSQIKIIRAACRGARDLCRDVSAREFSPARLKAIRQKWVDAGDSRYYINKRIGVLKQVMAWAAAEELIPGPVAAALKMVRGLGRGRTTAPDRDPVPPAPEADVAATLAHLPPPVAAMVRLQLLTGMRPGEACTLRPGDLDRSAPVWTYRPPAHKTEHHGRARIIYLGPQAQAVLTPFLEGCEPESPAFPMVVQTYRRTIARACVRASVPAWKPNQLRHNAATRLRAEFGLDIAQVILGHSTADVTQVYAEVDRDKAIEVMRRVG
jgi:integrase